MNYDDLENTSYVSIIFIGILILDILVNMNTAIFNKGVIEFKRRKIIKNYVFYEREFFYDVIGIISIFISVNDGEIYNFIQLIFFIKFVNFKKVYNRF